MKKIVALGVCALMTLSSVSAGAVDVKVNTDSDRGAAPITEQKSDEAKDILMSSKFDAESLKADWSFWCWLNGYACEAKAVSR